jgi:hypothetical protein
MIAGWKLPWFSILGARNQVAERAICNRRRICRQVGEVNGYTGQSGFRSSAKLYEPAECKQENAQKNQRPPRG